MNTSDKKEDGRLDLIVKLKRYSVFWVCLIVIFAAIIFIQKNKYMKLSEEIEVLDRQLDELLVMEQTLQQKLEYNKSDKFIEKYAHDEFGLVYSDEVIIYNDSYKQIK